VAHRGEEGGQARVESRKSHTECGNPTEYETVHHTQREPKWEPHMEQNTRATFPSRPTRGILNPVFWRSIFSGHPSLHKKNSKNSLLPGLGYGFGTPTFQPIVIQ
jgi:hypothetical protein